MDNPNASFYYFKSSGKWKYEGRGYVAPVFFSGLHDQRDRRNIILADNNGRWPGITSSSLDPGYHIVVLLDKHIAYGWPYMLPTEET